MTDPSGAGVLRTQTIINELLNRNYVDTTQAVLRAIASSTNAPGGVIQTRLDALDSEVARLESDGLKLDPDNPVLVALITDLTPIMQANALLVDTVSQDLQIGANTIATETGAVAATGATQEQLGELGVQWFQPDPEAINQATGFAQSDAFKESLSNYSTGTVETVQNQAVLGLVNGWGPRETARRIRNMTQGLPTSYANTTMRTLQTTSYRYSTAANRAANSDVLEYQIRISALQRGRTCMNCVSLHGMILPVEAPIVDHHNGLCSSVVKVKGFPAPNITPGKEFFKSLPKSEQESWMSSVSSGAAWRAFDKGSVDLDDFRGDRIDDVYGPQVIQRSLKEIMGAKKAKTFYSYNQGKPPESEIDRQQRQNRESLALARSITPDQLGAGSATGEIADFMYNFFSYDEEANPTFSPGLVDAQRLDTFYNIYTLGRGDVGQDTINTVRMQSAAILAADEQIGGAALTRADRNKLKKLSDADDETVLAEIDKIRDKRLKGTIAQAREAQKNRGKNYDQFTSAAGEDGANRLREANRPWYTQKDL
jgi:hypothetical protein